MLEIELEYRLIHTIDLRLDLYRQITDWCSDPKNGMFDVYPIFIQYKRDEDLTRFLLKWSNYE